MAKVKDPNAPFRKNEKVIATEDLPGVPEGTHGKVKLRAGMFRAGSWSRYWVFFDNGVDLGSVGADKLVRADGWEDFLERRARAAEEGASKAAEAAAAAAKAAAEAPAEEASAATSKVPAALLERARKRKEALGKA
ncbi:MAG: hypothetical protein OEY23_13555 [Acidimicrobiia bacterium]|nr:hypothetical protein [Acidimicrobiia bacterium]